jgi:tight adherence protein B
MAIIVVLVFASIFTVLVLVLYASGAGVSPQRKKALATLDLALATGPITSRDEIVDLRKNEILSAVPFINRWLSGLTLAPRLRLLLHQANLKWTAGGLLLMCTTSFVLSTYLIYMRTDAVFPALFVGALLGAAPFAFVLKKRKKRLRQFEQGLPEAIDLMVSALRAGHSLIAALRLVSFESPEPIGSEFRTCFDEQNYGLELRTAMDNLVTRVPLQDLRIIETAILIQKESGGNLAEVLDKTSYIIRERFRLKQQVQVHTAQGRLTGMILSFLPVVLGFAMYLLNPETMSVLWTRPAGIKLLYLSGLMTTIGTLIIRKIVDMDV